MPAAESYIDPRAWLLQRCAASAAVSGRSGTAIGGAPAPPINPLAGLLPLSATSFPDAAADALPAKPWAVDVKRYILSRCHRRDPSFATGTWPCMPRLMRHAGQDARLQRTFYGRALLG